SGRTARAGNEGDVVTIVLPEQRGEMRQIMRAAKIRVAPLQVNPMSANIAPEVLSLIGDPAPRVDPREIERRRAAAQAAHQRAAGHAPAGEGKSQGANARRKRSRGGRGGSGNAQGQAPQSQNRGQSGQSRGQGQNRQGSQQARTQGQGSGAG